MVVPAGDADGRLSPKEPAARERWTVGGAGIVTPRASGAYTGDISAEMLGGLPAPAAVIVGPLRAARRSRRE